MLKSGHAIMVIVLAKFYIAYDTKYGNTKLVAESIAEGMRVVAGVEVSIGYVKDIDVKKLHEADGLILGAPNHMARPSRTIMKFVDTLTQKSLTVKNVAIFGTYSGRARDPDRAVRKMEKIIEEKFPNIKLFSPSLSVRVYGVTGPLVEGELQKCKEYGRKTVNQFVV